MGKGGLTHGLKYQARSLVALPGSGQHSRWLAGTNALREENVVGCLGNTCLPYVPNFAELVFGFADSAARVQSRDR